LPQGIIDAWAAEMAGLNDLQQQAINAYGVLAGKSLFVVAPTGSGKTMIGELAAVQRATTGGRAVMLLPLRALVNDKYDYFQRVYGDQVKVVRASGEHRDQTGDLYSGHYDLALLTYEKFLNIAIASPYVMRSITTVVIDEVQNIADPTRGASLEFLLTLLRSGHSRGEAVQIIALSAVIGDTNGMEKWLGAGLLKTTNRPVPLRESVVDAYGNARHLMPEGDEVQDHLVDRVAVSGSQDSKPIMIPLVQRLVSENKKVIVFRATKGNTEGTASYLSQSLGLLPANSALTALPAGDLSSSSQTLRRALQGGVGFHNSDLDRDERAALESAFRDRDSDLRVLVSTTTLAMGINTPAEAVVIAGLRHPLAGPYSVAEYKNMAGRAGRPGFATFGEAYIVASDNPSPSEAWNRYVLGTPESIESHFLNPNTDPQTVIVRALAALGGSVEEQELLDLLGNSFALWRLSNHGHGQGWDIASLRGDLQRLVDSALLDQEPSGQITLTALGQFAGESGIEIRSVAQVSSALRFVPEKITLADLVLLAQVTVEVDGVYIPRNARSLQEQQRWPQTLIHLGCSTSLVRNLHMGGGDTMQRAKKAVACLLFISPMPLRDIEAELTRHMKESGIAGAIRSAASRTRDVVTAVAQISLYRGHSLERDSLADEAVILLETGAPTAMTELALAFGTALTRAEYLALAKSEIVTPAGVIDLATGRVAEILGSERANDLLDVLRSRH
jgi:replicative superfamily II helicase